MRFSFFVGSLALIIGAIVIMHATAEQYEHWQGVRWGAVAMMIVGFATLVIHNLTSDRD